MRGSAGLTALALTALTAQQVWGVRVHRVRPSRDAIAVAQSLRS